MVLKWKGVGKTAWGPEDSELKTINLDVPKIWIGISQSEVALTWYHQYQYNHTSRRLTLSVGRAPVAGSCQPSPALSCHGEKRQQKPNSFITLVGGSSSRGQAKAPGTLLCLMRVSGTSSPVQGHSGARIGVGCHAATCRFWRQFHMFILVHPVAAFAPWDRQCSVTPYWRINYNSHAWSLLWLHSPVWEGMLMLGEPMPIHC